ncbi:MAG: hypothetical protein Kow0069_11500 [Promethearchaeota archaeon]
MVHLGFKTFHEAWTDEVWNDEAAWNVRRAEAVFGNARLEARLRVKEAPSFSRWGKRVEDKLNQLFGGEVGVVRELKRLARKLARGTGKFEPRRLVLEYFGGDPSFELPVQHDGFSGRMDLLVKVDDERFRVGELKTGRVANPPLQSHLLQTAAYALMYGETQGQSCAGLDVYYVGKGWSRVNFSETLAGRARAVLDRMRGDLLREAPPEATGRSCDACPARQNCSRGFEQSENREPPHVTPWWERDYPAPRPGAGAKARPGSGALGEVAPGPGALEEAMRSPETNNEAETQTQAQTGTSGEAAGPVDWKSSLPKAKTEAEAQTENETENSGEAVEVDALKADEAPEPASSLGEPGQVLASADDGDSVLDGGEGGEGSAATTKTEVKWSLDGCIGAVVQNEKSPLVLSTERPNELGGAIREEFRKHVYAGQILAVDDEKVENATCAFAEVREIKAFPKTFADVFKKYKHFNIYLALCPFIYYSRERDKYTQRLHPADFSNHFLRFPSPNELMSVMHLFHDGVPFGLVSYEPLEDSLPPRPLPYYFPFSYKQAGFRGLFVVGSPGRGKTNFLKVLVDGLASYVGTPTGQPPAIVVIDIEDQFGELQQRTSASTALDEELWKLLGLVLPRNCQTFAIRYDGGPGTHTLSINKLNVDLLPSFFSELPTTSAQHFKRIVRKLLKEHPALTYDQFERMVQAELDADDAVNKSVRNAIVNAIRNGPRQFFDQGGEVLDVGDFMVPGKVSVLNVGGMSDCMPVLLYVLSLINRYKIVEKRSDPPLLLVVDEAHQLFPQMSKNKENAEYIRQIVQELIQIARRGRKRNFGLIFASQQPKDINNEVLGVFQTTIMFGLEGSSSDWIRETAGKHHVPEVLKLPQGHARIVSKELHGDLLVPLVVPLALNKHEKG